MSSTQAFKHPQHCNHHASNYDTAFPSSSAYVGSPRTETSRYWRRVAELSVPVHGSAGTLQRTQNLSHDAQRAFSKRVEQAMAENSLAVFNRPQRVPSLQWNSDSREGPPFRYTQVCAETEE